MVKIKNKISKFVRCANRTGEPEASGKGGFKPSKLPMAAFSFLWGWLWTQRLVWQPTVSAEAQLRRGPLRMPDVCFTDYEWCATLPLQKHTTHHVTAEFAVFDWIDSCGLLRGGSATGLCVSHAGVQSCETVAEFLLVEKEGWVIRFIPLSLQPPVTGVAIPLLVTGLALDMLNTFRDGFMV